MHTTYYLSLSTITMGIDIYTKWKNQTQEENQAQYTGFSTTAGDVGYLREAYHGEPYATEYFVKEAFNEREGAKIKAETLWSRLPRAIEIVKERETKLYKSDDYDIFLSQKSYYDFCKLCEKKEKETGEPCTIIASY